MGKKIVFFILFIVVITLILNLSCSMSLLDESRPESMSSSSAAMLLYTPPPATVSYTNIDNDRDGIYACYDYDDSDPKYPEPYFYVKDANDPFGSLLMRSYILSPGSVSTEMFTTIGMKLELTNGWDQIGIFNGAGRLSGNSFTFHQPDIESGQFVQAGTNNPIINSLRVILRNYPQYGYLYNLINNTAGHETGFNLLMLYNKNIIESDGDIKRKYAALGSMGLSLEASIKNQNYQELLTQLKSIDLSDITNILNAVRDYGFYSVYAEEFQTEPSLAYGQGFVVTASCAFDKQGSPGRPANTGYYIQNSGISEKIRLSVQVKGLNNSIPHGQAVFEINNRMHWEIIKLGIKRKLNDIVWESWNYAKIWDFLMTSIEVTNIYQGKGNLIERYIPHDWASDSLFKRIIFLHGYTEPFNYQEGEVTRHVPRIDFLTSLPINKAGLELKGNAPYGGIVGKDKLFTIGELNNTPLEMVCSNGDVINGKYIKPKAVGRVDVLVVESLGSNSAVLPRKGRLIFNAVEPKIMVNGQRPFTGNPVIGDVIHLTFDCDGKSAILSNDGIHLKPGISNMVILSGERSFTNYSNVLNPFISNLVLSNSTTVTYRIIQTGNDLKDIEDNAVLTVRVPTFSIQSDILSTSNGMVTVAYSLRLDPEFSNQSALFEGNPIVWSITSLDNNPATIFAGMSRFRSPSAQWVIAYTNSTITNVYTNSGNYMVLAGNSALGKSFNTQKKETFVIGDFKNLKPGEFIYPALGGRKIDFKIGPDQTVEFSATAGGFAGEADSTTGLPVYPVVANTNGIATVYFIGNGLSKDTKVTILVKSPYGVNPLAMASNLTIKYNDSFTLQDILTNTNVVLTMDESLLHTNEAVRYVQEMLNQVCPRKVSTAFGLDGLAQYSIIDEVGAFNTDTTNAVHYLKNSFVKATNDFCMSVNAFSNDLELFARLSNQYPQLTSPDMLMDYKLLRGTTLALGTGQDITPDGRDGLMEIYTNIVVSFINQMLSDGDRYAELNIQWKHREPLSTDNGNPGMAYNFGGADKISQFNTKITSNPSNVTSWSNYQWGHQPGLYESEINTATNFYAYDWAGIDCGGFIQRICKGNKYSNGSLMISDKIIKDLELDLGYHILAGDFISFKLNQISWPYVGNCFPFSGTSSKWLHRGDLIVSIGHHIVAVYGEPPDDYSVNFNVINAYGGHYSSIPTNFAYDNLTLDDDQLRTTYARKVIIMPYRTWRRQYSGFHNVNLTGQDDLHIARRDSPVGYEFINGRFTLWIK